MKKTIIALAIAAGLTSFAGNAKAQNILYTVWSGSNANEIFSLNVLTGIQTSIYTLGIINPASDYLNGLCVDPNGNIYTVENNNGDIYKISPDLKSYTLLASIGQSTQAMTYNSSLNVLDVGANDTISQVTLNGVVTTLNSDGQAIFGVTSDSQGNVYAANYSGGGSSSFVSKINTYGTMVNSYAINGANDVAVIGNKIFAAATGLNLIQQIDLSNGNISTFSSNSSVNLAAVDGMLYGYDNTSVRL
jgi:hypothetical protein